MNIFPLRLSAWMTYMNNELNELLTIDTRGFILEIQLCDNKIKESIWTAKDTRSELTVLHGFI